MGLDLRIGALTGALIYYKQMNVPISIVIPAHNEELTLPKTLKGLLSQSVLPQEIIIVNNASTDQTCQVVKRYQLDFKKNNVEVHLIHQPILGVARARNSGFFAATQPIISSIDCDSLPSQHWLKSIQHHFETTDSIAVTGILIFHDGPLLIRWLSEHRWFQLYFAITNKLFGFQSITTANCAVLKKIFLKTGGFDKNIISPNDLDDFDFASRLKKFGTVRCDPRIIVYTSMRRYGNVFTAIQTTIHRWKAIFRILKKMRD